MVEGTNRLHQGSSVKTLITLRRAHLQVALLPHYCTEVVTQHTGIWGWDKTIQTLVDTSIIHQDVT